MKSKVGMEKRHKQILALRWKNDENVDKNGFSWDF